MAGESKLDDTAFMSLTVPSALKGAPPVLLSLQAASVRAHPAAKSVRRSGTILGMDICTSKGVNLGTATSCLSVTGTRPIS